MSYRLFAHLHDGAWVEVASVEIHNADTGRVAGELTRAAAANLVDLLPWIEKPEQLRWWLVEWLTEHEGDMGDVSLLAADLADALLPTAAAAREPAARHGEAGS